MGSAPRINTSPRVAAAAIITVHRTAAADADGVRARALDRAAHGVDEVGKVHNMGLFARVDDGGVALRLGGGQHDVDGRAHRGHVQIDLRAVQPVRRFGRNHAAVGGDLRAQRLKALDVLVDGAVADGAAAGVGNLRLAKARQQRAHEIIDIKPRPDKSNGVFTRGSNAKRVAFGGKIHYHEYG